MIRSALVLDFDGVISDSAVESFLVALRTYVKLRPHSPLAKHDAPLRESTLAAIRLDPLFLEPLPYIACRDTNKLSQRWVMLIL